MTGEQAPAQAAGPWSGLIVGIGLMLIGAVLIGGGAWVASKSKPSSVSAAADEPVAPPPPSPKANIAPLRPVDAGPAPQPGLGLVLRELTAEEKIRLRPDYRIVRSGGAYVLSASADGPLRVGDVIINRCYVQTVPTHVELVKDLSTLSPDGHWCLNVARAPDWKAALVYGGRKVEPASKSSGRP